MNLRAVGCNFRTAAVDLRERLAFDRPAQERAAAELAARYGCEAVLLSTCNRVEVVVARPPGEAPFDAGLAAEFLAEMHRLPADRVAPLLYDHADGAAVRHLFRVAASLDSLIVGEGQIAGQVKQAFELARRVGATGPALNALFPHAPPEAESIGLASDGRLVASAGQAPWVGQIIDSGIGLDALEEALMQEAMARSQQNVSEAARLLGMTRPALAYRLKKSPGEGAPGRA